MFSVPYSKHLKCLTSTSENDLEVSTPLIRSLKPFQIEGVRFLYNQYLRKNGAVLNDDSKLGKTVETVVCLSSIHRLQSSIKVLVFCRQENFNHWLFHIHEYSKLTASIYQENKSNAGINCLMSSINLFPLKTTSDWDIIIVDDLDVDAAIKYLRSVKCKFKVWLAKDNLLVDADKLFKISNWVSSGSVDLKEEFGNYSSTSSTSVEAAWKRRQHLSIFCNRWLLRRTRSRVASQLPLVNPELFKTKMNKFITQIAQSVLMEEKQTDTIVKGDAPQINSKERNNNVYCDNKPKKETEATDDILIQDNDNEKQRKCEENIRGNDNKKQEVCDIKDNKKQQVCEAKFQDKDNKNRQFCEGKYNKNQQSSEGKYNKSQQSCEGIHNKTQVYEEKIGNNADKVVSLNTKPKSPRYEPYKKKKSVNAFESLKQKNCQHDAGLVKTNSILNSLGNDNRTSNPRKRHFLDILF